MAIDIKYRVPKENKFNEFRARWLLNKTRTEDRNMYWKTAYKELPIDLRAKVEGVMKHD